MIATASAPRLLVATETYWPEIGGGERQARSLARGLATLGYPVIILTRRSRAGTARHQCDESAEVVRLSPSGSGRWRKWLLLVPAFLALWRRRRDYDAVLVSGFRILGIAALLARSLTGKPTILKADSRGELSGEYFHAGLERAGFNPRSGMFAVLLRARNALLRRADAFVALSREMSKEYLGHGVPAGRVRVIANGVDTRIFRPASPRERADLRKRLQLPDGPVAIYTGRLVTYKGLPTLLRAWRMVPDSTLVLVGEGGGDVHSCEQELKAYVNEHALGGRVRFTGAVERVEDWLRAANIFVFPTENEAFGLSLAEAMACALPAVTTRIGGLQDFVVDGENALVTPPGNEAPLAAAVRVLLEDEDRCAAIGRAARRTVESRFSLDAVAAAYAKLLDELCRPPST
jgi:glycosyltransferase involved in cell wall biosynthesis